MIGGFLAAEPFRAEDTFNEKVTRLLRGKQGPKFGAIRRLRYLMGVTMVKHAYVAASLCGSVFGANLKASHHRCRGIIAALDGFCRDAPVPPNATGDVQRPCRADSFQRVHE